MIHSYLFSNPTPKVSWETILEKRGLILFLFRVRSSPSELWGVTVKQNNSVTQSFSWYYLTMAHRTDFLYRKLIFVLHSNPNWTSASFVLFCNLVWCKRATHHGQKHEKHQEGLCDWYKKTKSVKTNIIKSVKTNIINTDLLIDINTKIFINIYKYIFIHKYHQQGVS